MDTGAVLSVIPTETWSRMKFDKDVLIDSRVWLSAANKGALRVLGRTPLIVLNLRERSPWMSFLVVKILGRLCTCTRYKHKKTPLKGLMDTGAVLSVIPTETWSRMKFDKDVLIDSRVWLSAANKGALRVLGRTPLIVLNLRERSPWMSFLVVKNLDESDQFILGRDFIRVLM